MVCLPPNIGDRPGRVSGFGQMCGARWNRPGVGAEKNRPHARQDRTQKEELLITDLCDEVSATTGHHRPAQGDGHHVGTGHDRTPLRMYEFLLIDRDGGESDRGQGRGCPDRMRVGGSPYATAG